MVGVLGWVCGGVCVVHGVVLVAGVWGACCGRGCSPVLFVGVIFAGVVGIGRVFWGGRAVLLLCLHVVVASKCCGYCAGFMG